MSSRLTHVALRTSLIYAFVGALWILLSDRAVGVLAPDPQIAGQIQTYKGWGFISATTLLMYALLSAELRRYRAEAAERERAELRLQAELTERGRVEDEIRQLNAELERRVAARTDELATANAGLRELNALKDNLLASTTHDLRSPLGAIQNMAELLIEEDGLPDSTAHLPRAIYRTARQMTEMVNELLDLSRLEAGKVEVEPVELRISNVARQSLVLLAPTAAAKSIATELIVAPDEPLLIADWMRLAQVLNNLLSNAIKFTPPGGRVTVTIDPARDGVRVRVADTGLGIPGTALPHLFEKFRQHHTRGTANEPGSGLGLAIARHVVELHGGSIEVASEVQRGSTFTVYLPRSGGLAAEAAAQRAADAPDQPPAAAL